MTRRTVEVDQDITDPAHGTPPAARSVEQRLEYGLILLDKPPGPTSHEVVAWTRRMLGIDRAGHSGTLDPQVSGVLPVGLGGATKALGVLLLGSKEYHAVGRLHASPPRGRLAEVAAMFTGPIYQRPPQRSAVYRGTRVRTIHALDVRERRERLFLARIECESGTYVRKLIYDMGEVLGPGATMVELRRTRVAHFGEDGLVTLHELANAHALWKDGDGSRLASMILPVEEALSGIARVVVRDSAVDALCHGAQLAVPGILEISEGLKKGELAGVYTQKGEAVALAEAKMDEEGIRDAVKGQALETRRIIMAPGTYPKKWRTKRRDDT
ncbi:MAG: RNA-guided pseudouridylation complex pseudouridine synthase subunit Cbf5 [Nitrosopumilus sp.]|nr:RNA-guided pseudouridylation complex pseudouridine synthase subunit Cbf5 [Nitrosopumilus sp.]